MHEKDPRSPESRIEIAQAIAAALNISFNTNQVESLGNTEGAATVENEAIKVATHIQEIIKASADKATEDTSTTVQGEKGTETPPTSEKEAPPLYHKSALKLPRKGNLPLVTKPEENYDDSPPGYASPDERPRPQDIDNYGNLKRWPPYQA